MSEKNFLKHFAVIGGGTFINMLLGLLTTPIITRIVNPEEYGQLSIFTMYSGIALMILCLGLDQALVRYYYEKNTDEYKKSLLFKCIKLPIIISIIVSIIFITLSSIKVVNFQFNTLIITLLFIYTIIQLLNRFSLLSVRLAYKSKLYSILNIMQKLTFILVAFPLIYFSKGNYFFKLVIATIVSAFVVMIYSMIAQSNLWKFGKVDKTVCEISTKELIKYSYPFIISMGITTIFQAIDKISLNRYCSYTDVGIYSSAMSLINIFAIIQTTFNSLWAPMSMEHYANNKKDKTFYQKGNQIITIIMFFIGLSLILVKDVFAILLGEKYRAASYILPLLIFNPIMLTISETTVSGLVFMKKSKLQVVVAVGAFITNFVGNTILVPRFGPQGAAISTGLSYIIFFTLRTILSNRYFYVNFRLRAFYLLTTVSVIYALYNTFIRFNIGTIIGYFGCLVVLIFLYHNDIKWGINYLVSSAKSLIKKS